LNRVHLSNIKQLFPWEANNLEYTRRALDMVAVAAAAFIASSSSSSSSSSSLPRGFPACSSHLQHNWTSLSSNFDGCHRADGSVMTAHDAKVASLRLWRAAFPETATVELTLCQGNTG
jgi:hypothetical protein